MHAKIPVINAAKKPAESSNTAALANRSPPSNKSFNILPIINGTTIKNENFAAFSLSTPSKTAVEIVAPDLDIPGIIAIA